MHHSVAMHHCSRTTGTCLSYGRTIDFFTDDGRACLPNELHHLLVVGSRGWNTVRLNNWCSLAVAI